MFTGEIQQFSTNSITAHNHCCDVEYTIAVLSITPQFSLLHSTRARTHIPHTCTRTSRASSLAFSRRSRPSWLGARTNRCEFSGPAVRPVQPGMKISLSSSHKTYHLYFEESLRSCYHIDSHMSGNTKHGTSKKMTTCYSWLFGRTMATVGMIARKTQAQDLPVKHK